MPVSVLCRAYDVMVVKLSAEDIQETNFMSYSYADDPFHVVITDWLHGP